MSRFLRALEDVNELGVSANRARVQAREFQRMAEELFRIADSIDATRDGINRREILQENDK